MWVDFSNVIAYSLHDLSQILSLVNDVVGGVVVRLNE